MKRHSVNTPKVTAKRQWKPPVGAKYKSDELAMFYSIMANCLDDVGKSDDALKIYREAESMFKGDIGMARHLASVYYNIGVTLVRQRNMRKPELN
ncbi:MAG: hypothetical protein IPP63_09275 [Chloracidobacterium sp.]|nr:hypothetical protein [Chloracidobacterium sp.]